MSEAAGKFSDVAVVAIGRNEGERLRVCLQSVMGKASEVVYVDSGSSDGSVEMARGLGAKIVELDSGVPFTAARARNEGMKLAGDVPFVQFVDGDCQIVDGWLEAGRTALLEDEKLGVVCGRRRERYPERSIYNRLIDLEWDTPVGPAKQVGGDAMYRTAAFNAVGGFDASVMAGEEPELCLRLRHAGWKIFRVGREMTLHDAAMLHFGQWWRRNVRTGFGMLDVSTRFCVGGERIYGKLTRSARIWTIGWMAAMIVAWAIGGRRWGPVAAGVIFLAVFAQAARIAHVTFHRRKYPFGISILHGLMTMLSKWAQLQGQVRYLADRASGKSGRLIEYKNSTRPAREMGT